MSFKWFLSSTLLVMFSNIAIAQVIADGPIMGWSSWNTYHVNISDSLIMRQADALVSTGLKSAGYNHVNVDDGYFGWRDKDGTLHPHPTRFPRGMRIVADYIHSLGLKAGIYTDAGGNTCGSMYDNDPNGIGVGIYGYEYQDAQLFFNDWNFDFIKIDYCGAGTELDLDEQQRYTTIAAAIRSVATHPVSLNICRWIFPGTWAKDVATSWRISPDIRPRWSSVKNIIDLNLYLSAYCRDGHYNDMDMLEVDRGLEPTEEETHFGMWCLMSSPLLIGCDLTKISPQSLTLITNPELIAINQDTLHLQAHVVQHEGDGYVLVKDLEQHRGCRRVVGLYNPTDSICHFSVPLSAIEMEGEVALRDIMHRVNLKNVRDSIVADVPVHGLVLLKAEGHRTIEPVIYEAEWAYLPCYDALGKRQKQVFYAHNDKASGGMVVSWLGGRRENVARWNDVYSDKGGSYEMSITYVPATKRRLVVTVNSVTTEIDGLQTDGDIATVSIPVTLQAGYNTIEMGSPLTWAVDIDKFELKKIQ